MDIFTEVIKFTAPVVKRGAEDKPFEISYLHKCAYLIVETATELKLGLEVKQFSSAYIRHFMRDYDAKFTDLRILVVEALSEALTNLGQYRKKSEIIKSVATKCRKDFPSLNNVGEYEDNRINLALITAIGENKLSPQEIQDEIEEMAMKIGANDKLRKAAKKVGAMLVMLTDLYLEYDNEVIACLAVKVLQKKMDSAVYGHNDAKRKIIQIMCHMLTYYSITANNYMFVFSCQG